MFFFCFNSLIYPRSMSINVTISYKNYLPLLKRNYIIVFFCVCLKLIPPCNVCTSPSRTCFLSSALAVIATDLVAAACSFSLLSHRLHAHISWPRSTCPRAPVSRCLDDESHARIIKARPNEREEVSNARALHTARCCPYNTRRGVVRLEEYIYYT